MSNINPLKYELVINDQYLASYSELPKNYDFEDLIPTIFVAQELWLKPLLGINVYEQLVEYVQSGNIPEEWQTLLLKVYPYLGKAIVLEALPFISYRMTESGIVKHETETDKSIDQKEINFLQTNLMAQLQTLKKQLIDWLLDYGGTYGWTSDECGCDCSCSPKFHKPNPMKTIYAPRKKDMNLQ